MNVKLYFENLRWGEFKYSCFFKVLSGNDYLTIKNNVYFCKEVSGIVIFLENVLNESWRFVWM